MEVLLLQDIPEVGKKDDLLVVGDGYALNFLLPQSKALIATPTVRRRYADRIRRRAEENMMEMASQSAKAAAVSHKEIEVTHKATKTGKLYAAVTEKDIAAAIKAQHKVEIEESAVIIDEQIKALGSFEIKVKFGETEEKVMVNVKGE